MEKLIIIADRGRVRPVKVKPAGDDPRQKPHLIEESGSTVEMRPQSVHQAVTDHAGRFSQGGAVDQRTGMSYGEEHHLEEELETQALKRIAGKIGEIVASAGYPPWRLVVPQEILAELIDALPPAVHRVLTDPVAGDWTKLPLAELEQRFFFPSKGGWKH